MKRIRKMMAMALFALIPGLALAGGNQVSVKLEVVEGNNVQFELDGLSPKTEVVIRQADGSMVYQHQVQEKSSYSIIFDVTEFDQGTYFLEVSDAIHVRVFPFTRSADEFAMRPGEDYQLFKPVIRQRGTKVDVGMLALDAAVAEVVLFDRYGKRVFSEEVAFSPLLERRYDLYRLPQGTYSLQIGVGSRTYSSEVVVEQ